MANAKLGTKAVGSIVKLKVNGVAKEFIVVHKGLPSVMYDGSCSGVWLLMKDIYENRAWHSLYVNSYKASTIHSYLNSTFLNLFESNIQAAIKQVKIPYVNGAGNSAVASGANGLSAKIFLLSGYEVGFTTSDNQYFPQDGAKLSYFNDGTDSKRKAYMNGSAAGWWLRSPNTSGNEFSWDLRSDGHYLGDYTITEAGIRPALILPFNMEVDDSGNVVPSTRPMKLSEMPVGGTVSINVNGAAKDFLVVHQGKPSSLYDESCNGTWLLMKDIYENRQWHSPNINSYKESAIHSYLNSTFLNLFDSNIQNLIKQVKIPYVNEAGSSAVASGANGLSCKVFLLSGYEVGIGGKTYLPQDGAKLNYFNLNIGMDSKRIAYLNGSAFSWWLRSPSTNSVYYAWNVNSGGGCDNGFDVGLSFGIRPALVLPPDMGVDSSGNVTLPPPPATHKTLVNGTVYEVKGGKCMVDGTVYNILKGRTLIDGTGWDITFPERGTKLSTLNVGQSVFTNVNGVKKEFLVVHRGLPSSLYDASCDGTWLLMKDGYEYRQWNNNNVNKYEASAINTYLNGTFFGLFDSDIQGIIKQVKIPYLNDGGTGSVYSGANGLSCKIFLLSGPEVGLAGVYYMPNDGAKLDYFNANTGSDSKRIAYLNNRTEGWWLRSPYINYDEYVWYVDNNGSGSRYAASTPWGIRPCIILPSDALVDDEFNLIA